MQWHLLTNEYFRTFSASVPGGTLYLVSGEGVVFVPHAVTVVSQPYWSPSTAPQFTACEAK